MKPFKKILIIGLILPMLSACNTMSNRHKEDVSDITSTEYKVTALSIKAATPQIESDKMFSFIESEMRNQMSSEIAKMPNTGKAVGVIVTINKLALYIDPALTMLIGDNYSLEGNVSIIDMQTKQVIKQKQIAGQGAGRGGIAGFIGNASFTEEEKTQSAISGFTDRALYFVYPERSAFPF